MIAEHPTGGVILTRVTYLRVSDAVRSLRGWTDEDGSQPWRDVDETERRRLVHRWSNLRCHHREVWRARGGIETPPVPPQTLRERLIAWAVRHDR